ncbi:FAD:protein FMN transferase [uncultured Jatrophihabitans sp.]|uniref:FAD:protein FMN transferase n=1 Tax=uncultured Jatrophihabitans sp. TaxID=1610747 RepID=UPI0035C992B4
MSATPATWVGRAWSCTMRLVVTDGRVLRPATQDLMALLDRVDAAASRFRPDSALSRANAAAGRPVAVPHLLVELVAAALDAARHTDGAVDPTLGLAMHHIGYDRDIADLPCDRREPACVPTARVGGWRAIRLHREAGLLTVPRGCALDLGATAKAWTADHAAHQLAQRYGVGVLVELGGDLAVAGSPPGDGWRIRVAEREGAQGQTVRVTHGGLATSTTTVRRWQRAGQLQHHIVDPVTQLPAVGRWRTVSVAAGSALAANTASTAAIVRAGDAVERFAARGLAARFVDQDGTVVRTPAWPALPAARTAGAPR